MTDHRYTQTDTAYAGFSEDIVETAAIEHIRDLGWAYLDPADIAPDGPNPERASYGDVVFEKRLEAAVARINPSIPAEERGAAIRQLLSSETPSLIEENRRLHRLLTDGADVEFQGAEGLLRGDKVWLVDYDDAENNDWAVTQQFTVIEGRRNRRADIVLFLNGLPVAVIEVKNAANENATTDAAMAQLETYRREIPSLFRTNVVLVASDGMLARIGSLTADRERFMPWRMSGVSNLGTFDGMN